MKNEKGVNFFRERLALEKRLSVEKDVIVAGDAKIGDIIGFFDGKYYVRGKIISVETNDFDDIEIWVSTERDVSRRYVLLPLLAVERYFSV